jgi:ethanolamine utilization microcompartment shell protein EutL
MTSRAPGTRKHNRNQILDVARAMIAELECRAGDAAAYGSQLEVQTCLRTARYLKELTGIAQGQRSPAYWLRQPTVERKAA